ncbi:MAG: nucleoside hydrolase, partial [Halobacteriaceae archaeon]
MLAVGLASPDINTVGITSVAGNTTITNTTQNTLSILEFVNKTAVPVAKGCGRPLVDELDTAERIHGPDGMRGEFPDPTVQPIDSHAVDFIIEQAQTHGTDLTIAAVGPLTNIAVAIAKEPALPEMVEEIYVMGGAAMTLGNTTPAAEANFRNDPEAASRVMQDGEPKMVGLDVTNRATVSQDMVEEFKRGSSALQNIAAWFDYPDVVTDFGIGEGYAIHDAAVVADIIDNNILSFEHYPLEIDTTGGPSYGAVLCDKYGVTEQQPNASVAVDIDVSRFQSILDENLRQFAKMADS